MYKGWASPILNPYSLSRTIMKATFDSGVKSTASVASKPSDSNRYTSAEPSDLDLNEEDELGDVHIEGLDSEAHANPRATRSTDLVRLYLQEIGRVNLLERDEEVAEAQQVQQHMELLALRDKAAEEMDGPLAVYVHLLKTRAQLTAQLGHRPSLERWAKVAEIDIANLKPSLSQGKRL